MSGRAGGPAGVLLVDKPRGPTSRRVLDELERRLPLGPLGHAGTLDPLASGLLVVLAGAARRLQEVFMSGLKVYRAGLRLGQVSETLDAEGPLHPGSGPVPAPGSPLVLRVLAGFAGELEQLPPSHSAVRKGGRRAHRLTRSGQVPELAPRRVLIQALELLEHSGSRLLLDVTCGPGTYVRSLARDLGEALGCGAYLEELRRLRSGSFDVEHARSPKDVEVPDLLPLAQVLRGFPQVQVDRAEAVRLSQGAPVPGELPAGPGPAFAWEGDQPVCRLRPAGPGKLRSDLTLRPVEAR